MSPFEKLLAALETQSCRPKRRGNTGSAHCPAHDDRTPSLKLTEGDDGKALVFCHAGCPTEAVVTALGLEMRDLFPRSVSRQPVRRGDKRKRDRRPAGAQDSTYAVVPRFLSESFDAWCAKLFGYLDLIQGSIGRPARGDQAIADAIGCQARTVRTHALHLASAGLIRIDKTVTDSGGHKATSYFVLHNPARKRINENATTPLVKRRARPASRLPREQNAPPRKRVTVTRETRDTPTKDPPSLVRGTRDSRSDETPTGTAPAVGRLSRETAKNVGRETRHALGTWRGSGRYASVSDELDPDGDVADASQTVLDRAPIDDAPPLDDLMLARLFAEETERENVGLTEREAVASVLRAFPGAVVVEAP